MLANGTVVEAAAFYPDKYDATLVTLTPRVYVYLAPHAWIAWSEKPA